WPRSRSWSRSARSIRTTCTCPGSTSIASSSIQRRRSGSSSARCGRAEARNPVTGELELLGIVGDRLHKAGVAFMWTGSFALAFYATPRMTRAIDLVVELHGIDPVALQNIFVADFY